MTDDGTLPVATGRQVLRAARTLLRGRGWLLGIVVAVLLLGSLCALVTPFALGRIVELVAAKDASVDAILRLTAVMAAAIVAGAALDAAGLVTAARLFETGLARMRESLIGRALALPQRVVERGGSGDLVSRATDDVTQVAETLPTTVPAVTTSLFSIALTAIGLALLNPWFALIAVVVIPVHILAVRRYVRAAPEVYAAERLAIGRRSHRLLTATRALTTIQAYRTHPQHVARIGEASWEVVRWSLRARAVQNAFFSRLNLAEFLGMGAILVIGFQLVTGGGAGVAVVTTAMLLFLQLFQPINQLLFVIDDLQSSLASLGRIVGVDHVTDPTGDPRTVTGQRPLVQLDSVAMAFDGPVVVRDLSLTVSPGSVVALVGRSGAGKSTAAGIITGLHAADSGAVSIHPDAVNATLITQDTHVFSGTVRDNLTLSAPDADTEVLRDALSQVGALGFIDALPEGLDTVVGSHGRELTAAQAQHLAIARILLADPKLVVFDEATAEAGSAGSAVLESAARVALAGRGAVVIAHRLDQARLADEIIVLERGRVVERGTHDELIAAGSAYAELWRAWSGDGA